MTDYKHVTLPQMDAMLNNTTEECEICGIVHENVVMLDNTALRWSDKQNITICQPCINRMYAKACGAFNVRPAKLW